MKKLLFIFTAITLTCITHTMDQKQHTIIINTTSHLPTITTRNYVSPRKQSLSSAAIAYALAALIREEKKAKL